MKNKTVALIFFTAIALFAIFTPARAELSQIAPYMSADESGFQCGIQWTVSLSGDMTQIGQDLALAARAEVYDFLDYDSFDVLRAEGAPLYASLEGGMEEVDPKTAALAREAQEDQDAEDRPTWVTVAWTAAGLIAPFAVDYATDGAFIGVFEDDKPQEQPKEPSPADGTRISVGKDGSVDIVDRIPANWDVNISSDGTSISRHGPPPTETAQ